MSNNHTIKKKVAPAADASPHREDPREALAAVQRAAEHATLDLMASASGVDPASSRPQLVGAPVPSTEKPTRFHSLTYPQHPLPAYVASIAKRCQFCDHVIAYALSLLLRSHCGGRRLTAHMLHRGMLACLYAAHKMLWDRCFSAASYGRLVGISTREVVRCERFLMQLLDWRLFLSQCDIDRALHHAIAGTDVPCGAAVAVVASARASRRSSENTETEHELPSRMPSDHLIAGDESKSATPSGLLHQQQHQRQPSLSATCAERLKDALNFSASPHDA